MPPIGHEKSIYLSIGWPGTRDDRIANQFTPSPCVSVQLEFFPLDRLYAPSLRRVDDGEARQMLFILDYEDKYVKIFELVSTSRGESDIEPLQMFGQTAIIRRLEVGSRICKQYGVNCVTLEGDEVRSQRCTPKCLTRLLAGVPQGCMDRRIQ